MINKGNRQKRQQDYFCYLGKSINPALAVDNGFHREMYNYGAKDGYLVTFAGEPQRTFRSVDISRMVTECGRVMDGMSIYSAEELRISGLPLPIGAEHRYKGSLINSYLLNSCLCYVECNGKNGKDSFFATKHLGIIQALFSDSAETKKRKKVENFHAQLTTSHQELSNNIFEVIKLVSDRDGLEPSKYRINFNSKGTNIMPMYSIGNYIDKLIHLLSNHRVLITYLEDGDEYKVVTTLRSNFLARWLYTNNSATIKKVQDSWQNPFHFGEVILPSLLVRNQYVTIQVLDITSIQIME